MENWLTVEEYPLYEVSNTGRCRRRSRVLKVNWCGPKGNQYPYVQLYDGKGSGRKVRLHRVIAKVFIPNPKKLPEVNHKNLDRGDCRVENLEWVTSSENKRHAVLNGHGQISRKYCIRGHEFDYKVGNKRKCRRCDAIRTREYLNRKRGIMAAKKIKIVLNTDVTSPDCGGFSVDLNGYHGKGCDVDVAAFQNLGETAVAIKKPEWKAIQTGRVQARA